MQYLRVHNPKYMYRTPVHEFHRGWAAFGSKGAVQPAQATHGGFATSLTFLCGAGIVYFGRGKNLAPSYHGWSVGQTEWQALVMKAGDML